MTKEDNIKLIRFEMAEAMWVHNDVLVPHLWIWVQKILKSVVEYRKYGVLGKLFHFLVEVLYIKRMLGISLKRSTDRTHLAGRGFRTNVQKQRLDRIRTTVLSWGKPVAERAFPLNIIQ